MKKLLFLFLLLPDLSIACAFESAVRKYSDQYGFSSEFIMSVIRAESNFNCGALSSKGAKGLMQLMDATSEKYDVTNPFDPNGNIKGGVRLLNDLSFKYDNIDFVLAAYNAGEGAVEKYGGIPPYKETWGYIKKIKKYFLSMTGHKLTIESARYEIKENPRSPWVRFRISSPWVRFRVGSPWQKSDP
jgi:soluble lytic murein transglycosylase-like protein